MTHYICDDCQCTIDVDNPNDFNPEDGTTVCCWAPVITTEGDEDEESQM